MCFCRYYSHKIPLLSSYSMCSQEKSFKINNTQKFALIDLNLVFDNNKKNLNEIK